MGDESRVWVPLNTSRAFRMSKPLAALFSFGVIPVIGLKCSAEAQVHAASKHRAIYYESIRLGALAISEMVVTGVGNLKRKSPQHGMLWA